MRRKSSLSPIFALLASGCATGIPVGAWRSPVAGSHASYVRPAAPRQIPSPPTDPAVELSIAIGARERVVSQARKLVGEKRVELGGKRYRDDCTGLVIALYDQLGLDLLQDAKAPDNAVTAIYRFAQRNGRIFTGGRPIPGDLVFFRETYDQNRDGRANDGLTHVGVVEDVDARGTVTVIHRVQRGVVRYRMNLESPALRADGSGQVLNDWLRAPGPGRRELLTGQLFAAYATVLPLPSRVAAR